MFAYSLTNLTGSRRNQSRYMVVATAEVRRRTLVVVSASVIAGLFLALPFSLVLGMYAFAIITPLVVIAGNILFLGETRKGLRVTTFQTLSHRLKSTNGVFFINGSPFSTPVFIEHVPVVVECDQALGASELEDFAGNPFELEAATSAAPVVGLSASDTHVREVSIRDLV